MTSMHTDKHIVIATSNYHKYSETFIHDCVRFWPGKLAWLYGAYFPTHYRMGEHGTEIAFKQPADIRTFHLNDNRLQRNDGQSVQEFLKELQPLAVLAQYGPTGVSLMETCRQLNIPLYVHFHGFDAYREDILDTYGAEYPKLFKMAKGIIAVSEDMMAQLRRLGAPSKKLHLMRCGVEPAYFPQRSLPSTPVFSFVGRFVEKKYPSVVLQAFQKVVQQLPDARLVMAGDGELQTECRRLAKELNIADKTLFTGILSRRAVTELLLESTALVIPSARTPNGDSEGCPMVMIEAGAAGRAVIGTKHAGIPEVIDHGLSGVLVEPGDVDAIADAMILLGKNPELADKMGKCARSKVEAQFQRSEYLEQLAALVYGKAKQPVLYNSDKKILAST